MWVCLCSGFPPFAVSKGKQTGKSRYSWGVPPFFETTPCVNLWVCPPCFKAIPLTGGHQWPLFGVGRVVSQALVGSPAAAWAPQEKNKSGVAACHRPFCLWRTVVWLGLPDFYPRNH